VTTGIREERPQRSEVAELYESVGWSTYTSDPARLEAAIDASHLVLCARDRDSDALLGLARTISDGATIVYLQDLLVRPTHQRSGIGRALLAEVLARSAGIRQFVLLTDDEPGQRAFYESCGLTEAHDARPHEFRAFVRVE
jgi:GNAT superfamily N-acetyltransferase